jgi:hypothetical protein
MLILISALPGPVSPGSRLRPVEPCTAGDRWKPLVPMMCGPIVDQACVARGGSGAPRGGPWLARETPAGCPRQASPARAIALLGGALAGSGPGTSPCIDGLSLATGMVVPQRPAYPNHAHGVAVGPRGTMAAKCGDRSLLASWGWCAALERRDSKPPPSCAGGRGAGHEGAVTCSSDIPLVTAHGRPGPAVSGAMRTQRGPASLRQGWFRSRPVADAFGAQVLRGQGPERPGTARPSSPRMGIGGTGLHLVTLRH